MHACVCVCGVGTGVRGLFSVLSGLCPRAPPPGFLDRLRIELRMVGQLQEAGLQPRDALKARARVRPALSSRRGRGLAPLRVGPS